MGIVPVGGGGNVVPFSGYVGAVKKVGDTAVGGNHIVPALDWTGASFEEVDDDPELPDWVEEEYGGLHEGLEQAPIKAESDFVEVPLKAEVPVKRKPGRPRKVKV